MFRSSHTAKHDLKSSSCGRTIPQRSLLVAMGWEQTYNMLKSCQHQFKVTTMWVYHVAAWILTITYNGHVAVISAWIWLHMTSEPCLLINRMWPWMLITQSGRISVSCRNTQSSIAVQMIYIHQNCLRIKQHNVNHDYAMNSAITFLISMNLPFASKTDNSSGITYLWFCSTSIKWQPCGAGGSIITCFSSQWETSRNHLQLLKIIQSKAIYQRGVGSTDNQKYHWIEMERNLLANTHSHSRIWFCHLGQQCKLT